VSGAAGAGAATLSTAGSPTAATTTPTTASTTSACALPGPENDSQFSVCLLSFLRFCFFVVFEKNSKPYKGTQFLMRPQYPKEWK